MESRQKPRHSPSQDLLAVISLDPALPASASHTNHQFAIPPLVEPTGRSLLPPMTKSWHMSLMRLSPDGHCIMLYLTF